MRDTYEGISLPYLAQNARVNAAAAATLALAPPPPSVLSDRNQPLISRAPSGYDANLKWNAVPGATATFLLDTRSKANSREAMRDREAALRTTHHIDTGPRHRLHAR